LSFLFSKYSSELKEIPVIVHCFTGTEEELSTYIKAGYYIGITGWICEPQRGKGLREIVHQIPLERIMIETDSPFLVPKNIVPKPASNEPSLLGKVAETIALCYGIPPDTLIQKSTSNAYRVFSLLKKSH